MSDNMQYAILTAIGGYIGWYADDVWYWLKSKINRPGGGE